MTNQSTTTRLVLALALGILGMAAWIAPASAAPEPSPVSVAWEFRFEPGPLRLAWVEHEGDLSPYFYLTFKITNYSGQDLLFAPDVTLVADGHETYSAGRDVPSRVNAEILKRLDNPLIESKIDIVSTVLEGPEHARQGVVIWPARDLDVDEIKIFFSGLSGEFETYVVGRDTNDPARFTLRKSLMLRYATPGEFADQGSRPFELIEERWVMR